MADGYSTGDIYTIELSNEEFAKSSIEILQWDRKFVLFNDGVTGVYAWDNSSDAPYALQDLVPYLPTNLGAGGTVVASCPPAPIGRYMRKFRNRLWLMSPNTSKVYYSGTRTDLAIEGDDAREIRPWELWNKGMDLSRYNPGHGGSMIVGPTNQRGKGMMGTDGGLLVFKDSSIHLWDWPDSAAPHEVSKGATIRMIADNIGAVGQQSILQNGSDIIFLGRSSYGAYGIYIFNGTDMTNMSESVDDILARLELDNDIEPVIGMSGEYLFVAFDNGDGECQVRLVYDISLGAWIEFTSPNITCIAPMVDSKQVLFGTPYGRVAVWPSRKYKDRDFIQEFAETPIPFQIRSALIDAEYPDRDKKFRTSWASVSTDEPIDIFHNMLYDDEITTLYEPIREEPPAYGHAATFPQTPSYEYHFWEDNVKSLVSGWNESVMNTTQRAKSAIVEICGNASNRLSIHSLQVGWRDRSDKS
jgi:hypothetical protein